MKKLMYILCGMSVVLFSSCFFNEEDKFPESSSVRAEAVNDECQQALVGAPNGWVMEYYPNTSEYGSFLIHMSFTTENVVMTSSSNLAVSEKSLYKVKKSNGPELSFDTYNSILHMYSDPNLNNSFDGIGYGGDYEFMIMSVEESLITLKGVKTGTTVYMHRLSDQQTFAGYVDACSANAAGYVAESLQPVWEVVRGDSRAYMRVSDATQATLSENDDMTDADHVAVSIRPSSVFLNPGLRIGGEEYYQEFVPEGGRLVAVDNADIAIVGGDFEDFFSSTNALSYVFSVGQLSGALQAAVAKMNEQITSRYPSHVIQEIALTRHATLGYALLVRTARTVSRYSIDLAFDGDNSQFTIAAPSEYQFDNNGSTYARNGMTAYEDVVNALAGTYAYASENPFLLERVNFVKTDGTVDVQAVEEIIR